MDDMIRIKQLRKELHYHNYLYYVKSSPILSDKEFDDLLKELADLEFRHPESFDPNSPTQRVGSDLSNDFEPVSHRFPMLSLANTYNKEEVRLFYERVSTGLGGDSFEICCELKFDGLSISLWYEQGHFVRAVTRGDGVQGDDVTANVRTIKSIPLELHGDDIPDFFEMRGEVLMPWIYFESLNKERAIREEPLFANPRNAASGTLKNKNPKIVAQRKLDAYLYYMLGDNLPTDSHYNNMQRSSLWGFKISKATRLVRTLDEVYAYIDYWDEERKNLPVATDGIVLKVDSLKQQKILGSTAKTPRWAIAYKFQAERARTRLREVTYQVGRTGAVTPVANMDAVQLSGTVVRRASLHNEDVMTQLDLHIGDWVYVEKAGEIIPQIVGVDKSARDEITGPAIHFITQCPECGANLVRYEGEAASYCPNDRLCPPQLKGRIEHFISRDAMNITSLGPETVDEYYGRGLIHNVADLYEISMADISGEGGTREKSARKIIEGIRKSCEVPFERVLYALGIRFVGKVVAKLLARHFRTIDALTDASLDELLEVEGVGTVIAQSVRAYLSDQHNKDIIERLRKYGVQMALSGGTLSGNTDKLKGLRIVISGVFKLHTREEYKDMIERNGGKNVGNISAKTSFLLGGEGIGPSKLEKATRLGLRIVSENEFLEMLE